MTNKLSYAIALHGGAGVIPKNTDQEVIDSHIQGLQQALIAGTNVLKQGGSSIEAVERTVIALENDPNFNAGKGSVFNNLGEHELEASIMEGASLSCGAVSGLRYRKNPIEVARLILEKSEHIYLAGQGAEDFAESFNIPTVDNRHFDTPYRFSQWQLAKKSDKIVLDHSNLDNSNESIHAKGTVGAVALDIQGNLASATSTGGMTNKKYGRVGDSPIIGSGTYANNQSCAISCTGIGEQFLRHVVAYDIHSRMLYLNESLDKASKHVINNTLSPNDGGLIGIDSKGNIAMPFNSEGMFRAASNSDGLQLVEIW